MAQFAAHTAGRRYDAVVWGHPDAPHGIIDAPIGRHPSDPLRMAVVADGRPARTEYEVARPLRRPGDAGPADMPACRPGGPTRSGSTWRRSAIRCSAIPTYGERRTTFGLQRPFLHAAELSFDHPLTGERLTFTSPLPADLAAFLATAR